MQLPDILADIPFAQATPDLIRCAVVNDVRLASKDTYVIYQIENVIVIVERADPVFDFT